MCRIVTAGKRLGMTMVPNRFIDEFMIDADENEIKVYLYLLRFIDTPEVDIAFETVAGALDLTKQKVKKALGYWQEKGLLDFTEDKKGAIESICINDINSLSGGKEDNKAAAVPDTKDEKEAPMIPEYTPAQMDNFLVDETFKKLRDYVEGFYLPGSMSRLDINTLIGIYDAMDFSEDMVKYVYKYCAERKWEEGGNLSAFVNTVAISWYNKGYKTPAHQIEAEKEYSDIFTAVKKILGLKPILPDTQSKEIARWIYEYGLPAEVITEACQRVVDAEYTRPFSMAKSIIKGWYEKGVKSLDDVKKLDEEHKSSAAAAKRSRTKASYNQFTDYDHKTMSAEESRRLEKDLLSRNVKESTPSELKIRMRQKREKC